VKILCVLGRHNYGNPARGNGYEYAHFLPALRNLGHEVVLFESFDRSYYLDFADMNRKLLQTVKQEKPDIIFCVLLGYEVWLETLQLIRDSSESILINWSTDDSWKYEQFSRFISPAFHLYATTCAAAMTKAVRDGYGNFFLTQWAADSTILAEPLPSCDCKHSVSFIGTSYGNRPRWMTALAERGIRVECFGFGWENGTVAAEEIPRIMRDSIISLNFGDSGVHWRGLRPYRSRQIKARIFEVPGAGGFLMTEDADKLNNFYMPNSEIVTFTSPDDLAQKIRHYLDHPEARDRIARAGYARTRDTHTYIQRFSALLAAAQTRQSVQGTASGIDMAHFEIIARRHELGAVMKLFRECWRLPFVMLWGKERGPRAARRMLFELSWRLAGRHTYTVSGWPGRLFYRES